MNKFIFPKPLGRKTSFSFHPNSFEISVFKLNSITLLGSFLLLFSVFFPKQMFAQCDANLSCINGINITVDESCEFMINPSQVVSNFQTLDASCTNAMRVIVTTENDVFLAEGAQVIFDLSNFNPNLSINDSINITVYEDANGNDMLDGDERNCWGGARIEDKSAPVISACEDVTIFCYESLANGIGNPIPPIVATDNCNNANEVSITLVDSTLTLTTCEQDPNVKATLVKKWLVSDTFGNQDSCTQTITILRLPTSGTTVAAPANAMLECDSSNPPDTSVAALGYPIYTFDNNGTMVSIELTPENLSGLCSDLKVLYEDTPSLGGNCEGEEKYIRTFRLFDCCADAFFETVIQTIEIRDNQPPILTCPNNIITGTTSNSCSANVFIPAVGIMDACSNSSFEVSISTPTGTLNTNGGIITNVPVGTFPIIYTVADNCGNETSCNITLTVEDDKAPIPVCDESTVVALNNLGQAVVSAAVFDDGSTDNCGTVSFVARRMASNCGAATPFAEALFFTCCDLGETIMVEMQVSDEAGNTNSCMVEVQVQDKIDPIIICPQDKTIECGSDTSALVLGMAVGLDNCGTAAITYQNSGTLDATCGTGTLSRFWTATDAQGRTSSCIQNITVINSDPFSGNTDANDVDDIIFPADLTGANAISCLAFQNNPNLANAENTGEPIIVGLTSGCGMVGTTVPVDFVFSLGNGDCAGTKILRKWAVVDWCQVGNNPDLTQNGPGVWVHTQVIMVSDTEPPMMNIPLADFSLSISVDDNCMASVTIPNIPQSDIQDCSDNVAVSVTSNLGGAGFGPFTVGQGTYQATYLLDDGCGNTSTQTITITVADTKPPTPICFGVSSTLMTFNGSGNLTIPASTFLLDSSFDNCTDFADLDARVILNDLNDPTTAPTATEITFDCDTQGQHEVAVWVCDEAGLCDFCVVEILAFAIPGSCGFDLNPTAAGIIMDNESGSGIEAVEVNINDGAYMGMTDEVGQFSIPNLPMHEDYNIKPTKNSGFRNGVSTYDIVLIQKHILGTQLLDSPYKIIAADVNDSKTLTTLDVVKIRKLILLIADDFPNEVPSWRFVDANFEFPNPANPFATSFPEEKNVQDLDSDMMDLDFVAIKVGDVSGNASPQLLSSETRGDMEPFFFKTQQGSFQKGEEVSLIFESESQIDLSAWQYSLSFDQDALAFLEIEKIEEVHYGSRKLEKGVLTFAWDAAVNVGLEDKLMWFEIRFLAKRNLKIAEVININSSYTNALAYDTAGEEYEVQLQFEKEELRNESGQLEVYENTPNPFQEETTINFYLPTAGEVELNVYDVNGKLLKSSHAFYEEGNQSVQFEKGASSVSGVLYYQLSTSKDRVSGKMILLP